jgi:CrcB protein
MRFLLVCFAGALGTGARFALSMFMVTVLGTQFPYGTIVVNILGSFAMGVVLQLSAATDVVGPTSRLVLTTGFLGGFTTYSAFNADTVTYLQQNLWGRAFANVAVTLVGCLLAGFAGVAAMRRLGA